MQKVTFFPPGFRPDSPHPFAARFKDHSQKPMEAVQQAADQVKVWGCSWFLLKAVRYHRWNVDISEWGKMNIRYIWYMIYIIFHLLFYIYIYCTVHMFFQNEVIGSSSWLMLVFRIGEPFQNSLDIRKKLIMSAADSHKHKHVKHSKRTLWVTCFFLVAFLNCLPFPKSRSIRTSGTSSRERACPRACWILAFLQSQLWARRCLEKSRLFLLTQIIT